jgi:polar amino acid transport system substrate-binding protein
MFNKTNIKVAISEAPPMVMRAGSKYHGFEVELWEQIAQQLNLNFHFDHKPFDEMLESVKSGEAEVGLGAITVNEERERQMDFSHYILDSGLLVVVSGKNKFGFRWGSVASFFKKRFRDVLNIFLILIAFLLIFGHIIWFFEKGVAFSSNYLQGIAESIWWIIVTSSTIGYGDFVPKTLAGRLVAVGIIFIGYTCFAFVVAELSSIITSQRLKHDIVDHEDLRKKRVATKKGTLAVNTLEKLGANVVTVKKMEEAFKKLNAGSVDAVVYDAPMVLHYLRQNKSEKYRVVGDIFEPQYYGLGLRQGSILRERINQTLLKLRENGYYDMLYHKWFGDNRKME